MKALFLPALVASFTAVIPFARANQVTVIAHGRSIDLGPSSATNVPGVGQVTTYFSTFNYTGMPLYGTGGEISGELRPRAGTASTYEGGYIQATSTAVYDYGTYTVTVPSADSDGNGIPDVLQFGRDGSFTATGSGYSGAASLSFSISIVFHRSANSGDGTYSATTTNSLGQTNTVNGTYSLVTYQGTAQYSRGSANTLSFSLTGVSTSTTELNGTTTYTCTADQLKYAAFTAHNAAGISYSINAGTLTRSGDVYRGTLTVVDGFPATTWPDFTSYSLEITDPTDTNGNGVPDLTDALELPPTITAQPTSRSVTAGSSTSLSVTASGTAPLTYQWYLNDAPVAGATSSSLVLSNIQSALAGTYYVVVTNSFGSATSDHVTVTVNTLPPVILNVPEGADLLVGESHDLTVQATGDGLKYQWFLNGTPIAGATNATYTVRDAQPWDAGGYGFSVSNAGGSATASTPVPIDVVAARYLDDEFSASSVDPNLWTAALPFSDSATIVGNGMLTLKNRGRLLSKGALPTAYTLKTRFRLSGSSYDQFAIYVRTDGATTNGSFNSGVAALFQYRSGDQGSVGVANIKIHDASGGTSDVTGNFPLLLSTWYDAEVDDDGATVIVKIDGQIVVQRTLSSRAGNLVGLQNREGGGGGSWISNGSITDVDYLRVLSPASVAAVPTAPVSRLANMSTRAFVGTGAEAAFCGFVTAGTQPHRLIIRAAGPALAGFGVHGTIADPQIVIRNSAHVAVAANDNWSSADQPAMDAVGAFQYAAGSTDAAVLDTFAPGLFTVEVSGRNAGTGAALIEAYDRDTADEGGRLINLSSRAYVGGPGQELIAGIAVTGTSPRRVLVRAIGPTLAQYGLTDVLPDPVLTVYGPGSVKLLEDDDWAAQPNVDAITAAAKQAGAFDLSVGSKDAALLLYLPPGQYSFQVTGKNGATGIAMVEVYESE